MPVYDVVEEGNEPDKLLEDERLAVEVLETAGLMDVDVGSRPGGKSRHNRGCGCSSMVGAP